MKKYIHWTKGVASSKINKLKEPWLQARLFQFIGTEPIPLIARTYPQVSQPWVVEASLLRATSRIPANSRDSKSSKLCHRTLL